MKRASLLAALLLAPGLALAQLQSGPGAPAVSSQLPPSEPPAGSRPAPGAEERTGAETRTAPPADHRVLGGPPVPGARQPQRSEGFATGRDPIPPGIGDLVRPDAPTTGIGRGDTRR